MFYVLPCVILFLCFSVLLALRLPRLGKRELILVLFVRLFDLCLFGFVGFSSSWCLGRAAVCDCGTPWTSLLSFFFLLTTDYVPGETVNGEYYLNFLRKELRPAMRKKRPALLKAGPILLQNNAMPHKTGHVTSVIDEYGGNFETPCLFSGSESL